MHKWEGLNSKIQSSFLCSSQKTHFLNGLFFEDWIKWTWHGQLIYNRLLCNIMQFGLCSLKSWTNGVQNVRFSGTRKNLCHARWSCLSFSSTSERWKNTVNTFQFLMWLSKIVFVWKSKTILWHKLFGPKQCTLWKMGYFPWQVMAYFTKLASI